jgi:hypothetical protein
MITRSICLPPAPDVPLRPFPGNMWRLILDSVQVDGPAPDRGRGKGRDRRTEGHLRVHSGGWPASAADPDRGPPGCAPHRK